MTSFPLLAFNKRFRVMIPCNISCSEKYCKVEVDYPIGNENLRGSNSHYTLSRKCDCYNVSFSQDLLNGIH